MSGITIDTTSITADTGLVLADGTILPPPSSLKYIAQITSEHNQKPNYMAMVSLIAGAIGDIVQLIQSIPSAFDLDTAIGAQLDIIGLWVGQSRIISNVLLTGFFGFADNPAALPFGELTDPTKGGVFYELGASYDQSTTLADDDYRTILRARITRNQSNGNLADLESALSYIFAVPCRVSDIGSLSLAIIVSAPISQTKQALLTSLDLLPRPAGVAIGSITYSPL